MNSLKTRHENITDSREERLRDLLQDAHSATAQEQPPQRLRDRIETVLAAAEPSAPSQKAFSSRRRWGLRLAGVAAVFLLLVLAGTAALWPRWVVARTLAGMEKAMRKVVSVHTIRYEIQPEPWGPRIVEMWLHGDKAREELRGTDRRLRRVEMFADGKLYAYEPEHNTVTVYRRKSFMKYPPSGFTVEAVKKDLLRWSEKGEVHYRGGTQVRGRPARLVQIDYQEPAGPARVFLYADPTTDLPFRLEFLLRTKTGHWEKRITMTMSYNEPMPPRLFRPDFPKTAKWKEVNEQ
jgi:hypothetical protein